MTFYGGLFSVLPAYLADVFGPKHVGAIHGRALTAWSGAAIIGPSLMSFLRQRSYETAVRWVLRFHPLTTHSIRSDPRVHDIVELGAM